MIWGVWRSGHEAVVNPWAFGPSAGLAHLAEAGAAAVRASALMLSALLSFALGLILNAITHSHREIKRPAYLAAGC